MGITIAMNKDSGILEVTYSPHTVSPQDLAEQRDIVADALLQNNTRKVLIDASSLPKFPPILTSIKHNECVSANEVLRETRFAVVCSLLGRDERTFETTGVNRGVHVKCFTSREEAAHWLMR